MRYIVCFLAVLWAAPLAAQDQTTLLYDVSVFGIKVGELSVSEAEHGGSYTARSHFRTTGLVAALKRLRADVSVSGRVMALGLRPDDYAEAIDNGNRITNVKVRFAGKPPVLISGETGSATAPADTSALRDALDPMTALYILLRDQPPGTACTFDADIYDGHRHARLTLDHHEPTGKTLTCSGAYQRLSGYSSAEKKHGRIPITISYEPAGEQVRAARVWLKTKYGPASLTRQ